MKYIYIVLFVSISIHINAQQNNTDANIIGHVTCNDEHIAFANIMVENTAIGTSTDETGHFMLINMPEGTFTIKAQALGYTSSFKTVTVKKGETIEIKFELTADVMGLEEVVITGDRNKKNRKESPVIVNTISPKALEAVNSTSVSEGLNYCSGLRMENNCQNCGFNQLRINGMEGPYSQILINSRAIFSGLAGVYGLELIPASMIERVEIVRGGGSALYGSNAIAGTVNLILKDPIRNTYEFGSSTSVIGGNFGANDDLSKDINVNLNASLVSSDAKTGMAIYGFHRERDAFDANNDGFTELSRINNTTIGTRIFHRFNQKSKLSFDYFTINEERRGGNNLEQPNHMADISEAVKHNINTIALNFDRYVREKDMISIYASTQHVKRDSYYGASQSLADYGQTNDLSYTAGLQYTLKQDKATLIAGVENTGSRLKDIKLGYADYSNATIVDNQIVSIPYTDNIVVANQMLNTAGAFAQFEYKIKQFNISAGGRFDNYMINDFENLNNKKIGNVFSPRANVLYDITDFLQARLSYSQGYRAPQVFDEDLHIESSGSRKIIHRNSADLSQETSQSISASIDFNKTYGKTSISFLVDGFYTILQNPFVNEYGAPDENGTVVYTRVNADAGAVVQGVNFQLDLFPSSTIAIKSGLTLQQSMYETAQEFGEKRFFRTPSDYAYFTFDFTPNKKFGVSSTGTYTGKMLVPYFGLNQTNPELGELRETSRFFDFGLKAKYNIKINGAYLQVFGGVKNILNSYQSDFDSGINRDPSYIYGPMAPRTIYFGIKLGNAIV